MLPKVSYVQKCPECAKYYLPLRQEVVYADEGWSLDCGTLTYDEAVEAMEQLAEEGFADDEESNVRILLLHAFNDCFYRMDTGRKPTEADIIRNRENIRWLIYIFIENDLLRAELYREAGDMERAIVHVVRVVFFRVFRGYQEPLAR